MQSRKYRIAIFASGNGTNAERVFEHFKFHPEIEVVLLMTNNPKAYALERAARHGITSLTFTRDQFREGSLLRKVLSEHQVTHIVLAGFLWLIPEYLLEMFPDKIINIHPALLPRYGGKGMYGAKVHEAVKAAGDVVTGITIHLVNNRYDEGRILFQAECAIDPHLTPDDIAQCVHQLEYEHYPRVIEDWILGG